MENQEQPIQTPMPAQPAAETVVEPTKKSLPKWPLIIVAVMLVATLLTSSLIFYKNMRLNPKQAPIQNLGKISVTVINPNATSSGLWKTYINTKFGFEIKYPAQGDIALSIPNQVYDPDKTHIGDCGNAIKETVNPNLTSIDIDSFFSVAIYNSTKSIADWIKDQPVFQPDLSKYELLSGVNADEAYREKANQSLMEIAFYKKNDHIFILSHVQNLAGGCIDYNKNIYNWDIPNSFKFTNSDSSPACKTDADCNDGKKCEAVGPIKVGQPQTMMCIGKGEMAPL
jgi:hypothetical protein